MYGIDPINCFQCRLYLITVTTAFLMTPSHHGPITPGPTDHSLKLQRPICGIDLINSSQRRLNLITVTTLLFFSLGHYNPILQNFSKRLQGEIESTSLYVTFALLQTPPAHLSAQVTTVPFLRVKFSTSFKTAANVNSVEQILSTARNAAIKFLQ